MPIKPEGRARQAIDLLASDVEWTVQHRDATQTVRMAVCECPLKSGYGEASDLLAADYLLFVEGSPVGIVEAKREGSTLTGMELLSSRYGKGVPDAIRAPRATLPLVYESTGIETRLTNLLEPDARGRSGRRKQLRT